MDDNTKVMLKLATFLAQQNNSRVNNTGNQNPLTELATQLLMNSTSETLAIPTSLQSHPAKQLPSHQPDNSTSSMFQTQAAPVPISQNTSSNHMNNTYSVNASSLQGNITNTKSSVPRANEMMSLNNTSNKDMIPVASPINRDSFNVMSPVMDQENFSPINRDNFPISRDTFNVTTANSYPINSPMNHDTFTTASSVNRDSFTMSSAVNRDSYPATSSGNSLSSSPATNREMLTVMPPVNRDTFSAASPVNRETYPNNPAMNRDTFNVNRDNMSGNCPETRDSFSSDCSATRVSFSITSPRNRENYTNTPVIGRDSYSVTSPVNSDSYGSGMPTSHESYPVSSPSNRISEDSAMNSLNMMRGDISRNTALTRVPDEMNMNQMEDMVVTGGSSNGSSINSGLGSINSSMSCNMSSMNSSSNEVHINSSNNCAYYKRPIQGEKGRSYPQPVILRSRPRPVKERSKRGPKEKDYFRTAFFCLPNVTARLPRFTSSDPREQDLVLDYQKQGYGFPAKDYFEGKPQKTYIRLSHDEESFRCFLLSIYPKLEGKYYELYRIDRQRNLVRIEAKTPRGIKNAKYQGTIIILPYPEASNPPSAIVHNPSSIGDLPVQLCNDSMENINENNECEEENMIPSPSVCGSTPQQSPFMPPNHEVATYDHKESYELSPPSPERDIKPFQRFDSENSELFQRISLIKQTLSETRNLKMDKRSIVGNLLELYRAEHTICNYDIRVTFNNDPNLTLSNDPSFQTRHMFCIFWKKIFNNNFVGNEEYYPVISPEAEDDMFEILGRILAHGLILCNYWPIQFAVASATYMLCQGCSDELILKSFTNCLSGFDQRIVMSALKESRSQIGEPTFSSTLETNLSAFLWTNGCQIDRPGQLPGILLSIARSFLIYQPYWALVKLKKGMEHCSNKVFKDCSESDVENLYKTLTPEASQICKLIKYEFSQEESHLEIEKTLQTYLEKLLWEMSLVELANLLQLWTGVNCLSQQTLFVKFVNTSDQLLFQNYKSLLRIPRKIQTFKEFTDSIQLLLDGT
ncbi:uncharacterized protein LOC106878106 [Octopus bimaculoides]|uniref:HECT domain-containing protein n=1 Tax=Octopus bimaculoides TaxID=37653 RepID=A0A0L8GAG7_OCTBM|nr:uncharacterized protein LOC106878106 [Octopus bimaculoides]XP_014782704.1 uncharacterized protein LOC106878106 [Octopus bimaculoides]|eukprot:XP_014782703.1 PREDICTED: uncharacterized protein LOC106878106 [Octopus bimaculoides]